MLPVTRSLTVESLTDPKQKLLSPSMLESIDVKIDEFIMKSRFIGNERRLYHKALFKQIVSKLHYPFQIKTPLCFYIKWNQLGGFGDFMFGIKTALTLKKHFPSSKILLEGNSIPINMLDFLKKNQLLDCFINTNNTQWTDDLSQDTLCFCMEVGTPSKIDNFPKRSIVYRIDEYNGWRSTNAYNKLDVDEYASKGWYTAGLGLVHEALPAVGVHIDSSKRKANHKIDSLHNFKLRDELKAIWSEESNSRLFFGYNSKGGSLFLYRYIRSVVRSRKVDDPYVFVIVDTSGHHKTKKQELLQLFNWCWYGVSEIKLKNLIKGYDECQKASQASNANPVTFIFSSPLDPHDMKLMNNLSEDPTLMSGDQSFAEIISMKDKILFYQQQSWKKSLMKEFTQIAAHLFGEKSTLMKFLSLSLEIPGYVSEEGNLKEGATFKEYMKAEETIYRKLANYLNNSELQTQFNALFNYLRNYYNIEHWLVGDIKKQIIQHQCKQLKGLEKSYYESQCPTAVKMRKIMAATISELGKRPPTTKIKERARKKVKI